MENMAVLMNANRIGNFPKIKTTLVGVFAAIGSGGIGGIGGHLLMLDFTNSMIMSLFGVVALWVANRYAERGGDGNNAGWVWWTDPPESKESLKAKRQGKADMALTAIYREVYQKGDESPDMMIELIDTHPRFTVHVINHDDLKIEGRLKTLARRLDIETEVGKPPPFQIVDSWGGGASALILPKVLADGENPPIIPFDESQVVPGKLISYLGVDVRSRSIRNNRDIASHLMISGTTGSGKTILFRNEIFSMKLSAPNAIIYSIDYKSGIKSAPYTKFTSDMVKGVGMLIELEVMAAKNWKTVSDAGFDNWFDYDNAHPGKLAPIFLNIDEFPQFVAKGDQYLLEEWEQAKVDARNNDTAKPVKPMLVLDLVGEFLRVYRAGGVFVTIGIQKPKAKELPTEFRDMFDARAAMRVVNADASRVAIDMNGAESLPEKGGVMFRIASRPVQVGAAAFMTNSQRDELMERIGM